MAKVQGQKADLTYGSDRVGPSSSEIAVQSYTLILRCKSGITKRLTNQDM